MYSCCCLAGSAGWPGLWSRMVSARMCSASAQGGLEGGAGHEGIDGVGGLAGGEFDGLGDEPGQLQGVDRFPALLGEQQVFVILLRPAEPFHLDGGERGVGRRTTRRDKTRSIRRGWRVGRVSRLWEGWNPRG